MIEHICCVLVKEVEVNFDQVFRLSGWRLHQIGMIYVIFFTFCSGFQFFFFYLLGCQVLEFFL